MKGKTELKMHRQGGTLGPKGQSRAHDANHVRDVQFATQERDILRAHHPFDNAGLDIVSNPLASGFC